MDLHHVLTAAAWQAAQQAGIHDPPELARDGFLHCCTPAQLAFVLDRHFGGVADVLVLTFDSAAAAAALDWVESEPGMPPFPHLRGPIPLAAIRSVGPRCA